MLSAADIGGMASMIALDRLLDGLDVEVTPLGPDPGKAPTVHCRRDGTGLIELACGARLRVMPDRVALVPARGADDVGALGDGSTAVASGDGVGAAAAVRARVRVTYHAVDIFEHLRAPLIESLGLDDPIRRDVVELADELVTPRPGRWGMVATLLRRIVMLLLRRCCARGTGELSAIAGLEDTRLGRALAAMHEHPERAYTLPELAEVAGMSRSVFAARFADAVARSPIEFLKTVRLTRAARLLADSDLPVKTIAAQVGYESRSSFTRAFSAAHGSSPTAFRAAAAPPDLTGGAHRAVASRERLRHSEV
jgi:AraC-like DNA-binding protein